MNSFERSIALATAGIRSFDLMNPLVDLAARVWLANVFWKAGLTKIASWDTTVLLFTYEYQVPVLSPGVAALLATVVELVGASALAIGLGGRVAAAALLILNCMAVIAYPGLSEVGVKDHIFWGILLGMFLVHGPGRLSIDHFVRRRLMPVAEPDRHGG